MDHDHFIGQVQHHARLSSRGDAERITRATLETLAERLGGAEPDNLADQLPQEIGHHLRAGPEKGAGQRMNFKEFVERAQEREEWPSADYPDVVQHVRAVFATLQQAASAGELAQVRQQLPEDFAPLFEPDVAEPRAEG